MTTKASNDWWLVTVTFVDVFGFLPQNFGRWWRPTNDGLRQNECSLSGGNTPSLLFALSGGGDTKNVGSSLCTYALALIPTSHFVKCSLPNIFLFCIWKLNFFFSFVSKRSTCLCIMSAIISLWRFHIRSSYYSAKIYFVHEYCWYITRYGMKCICLTSVTRANPKEKMEFPA